MSSKKYIPVWQLNEVLPDMVPDEVQLFIWSKGICISVHNQNGDMIQAKSCEFEEAYSLESIEAIILNESMLANPDLVGKVWMAIDRHLLVPQKLQDRALIDTWFSKLFYRDPDETMTVAHADEYDLDVYFAKKDLVKTLLSTHFPLRKQRFVIPPKSVLNKFEDKDEYRAVVICLGHTCALSLYHFEELVHFIIFDIDSMFNVVERIATYWDGEVADYKDVAVLINGVDFNLEESVRFLEQYFVKVNQQGHFSTSTFLKTFVLCE